jgi:hypothetical protein
MDAVIQVANVAQVGLLKSTGSATKAHATAGT